MGNFNEIDKTPIEDFNTDTDTIKKIERSVDLWYDYFTSNNDNAYEDMNFALGNQWEAFEAAEYNVRQKIMLTHNVLYSFVTNIIGEQRQNTPTFELRSLDNNTDQKLLNFYNNLLRFIDYKSNADYARQVAFMNALLCGYGAWRVMIDFEDSTSMNKQLIVQPIIDIQSVYFDRNARTPTKSDGMYFGLYTTMSVEEFIEKYPDFENPVSLMPPQTRSNYFYWRDTTGITVVEHFHKVFKQEKLYKLSNGESVLEKDLSKKMRDLEEIRKIYQTRSDTAYLMAARLGNQMPSKRQIIPKVKIVDDRKTEVATIKHYKAIKGHILEEGIFPGENLPGIFVDGDSHWLDGRQSTKSYIHFAKDTQKFLNMIMSDLAQLAKVGHKGEFLATEAMIGDYKEMWRNPEKTHAARMYKPDPLAPTGKPEYIPPAELPMSLVNQASNLYQTIQLILGRSEANRGDQGNEISGVAIANRAKQGNTSVFTYIDNLNKAVEQTAKICLNLIPEIYMERSNMPLRSKDGKISSIELDDNIKKQMAEAKLDVSVNIGPAFEIQKQEAFNQLITIVQALQLPPAIVADLVAENTNLENTPQLVERIKKFVVNPAVIAFENGEPPPPTPPNPQLQIAQEEAKARLMEAQAKIAKVQQDSQTSQVKASAEIQKAKLEFGAKVADVQMKQVDHQHKIHQIQSDIVNKFLGNQQQT